MVGKQEVIRDVNGQAILSVVEKSHYTQNPSMSEMAWFQQLTPLGAAGTKL